MEGCASRTVVSAVSVSGCREQYPQRGAMSQQRKKIQRRVSTAVVHALLEKGTGSLPDKHVTPNSLMYWLCGGDAMPEG